MPDNVLNARVEAIRRLARKGGGSALQRAIQKSRAEDIAVAIRHLAPAEKRLLYGQVADDGVAAEVLVKMDGADFESLVGDVAFDRLVRLLGHMEVDDQADVIARLPEDLREKVLAGLHPEEKEDLEEIMQWPEDSAGGIMHPLAFRLDEGLACKDAIAALQEAQDLEMVFYLYVENASGQLVGVTSLRSLLTHPPQTPLPEIMTTEVITVLPTTDQEDVARIVGRYDLLAVPVVDVDRRLLGIVTIDDVVDVIREEAVEDMMLMAGVGEQPEAHAMSTWRSFRQRLPWLTVTLAGGLLIAQVVEAFRDAITAVVALAAFMPVILGMGGNVGTQAATIMVRNIATGRAAGVGVWLLGIREAGVGGLLGLVFGVVLGVYGWLVHGNPILGISVAVALVATLVVAASLGTLVPLSLQRLGADPAVATGPFVTTGMDLVGLLVYFGVCTALLQL